MIARAEIKVGHVLKVLHELQGSESIETPAIHPEPITPGHVFVGVGQCPLGVLSPEGRPVSYHLRSVPSTALHQTAEGENDSGLSPLDPEEWKQLPQGRFGLGVTDLPGPQSPPSEQPRPISVEAAAEEVSQELDREAVDHPHLDSGVVSWSRPVLVASPLDPDVPFTINDSGRVGHV